MRTADFCCVFLVLLGLQVAKADLLPIVERSECQEIFGRYSNGFCYCSFYRTGSQCENPERLTTADCTPVYDCYNCEYYTCPTRGTGDMTDGFRTVEICDGRASTVNDGETVSVTIHSTACRNVTSYCFQKCECPSGLAYLASSCFKKDLVDNFGFFILVMTVLTLFSIVFEFGVHRFERRLKKTNRKALLGIINAFKSELTLIGLIGLSLYLASSSEAFEHVISALGGKEEIIEAIHFLVFFLVLGYFFTLGLSLILTKLFLRRRLRNQEEIFQEARRAVFNGESYEGVKQDIINDHISKGCFKISFFRQYNAFRMYFMNALKNEYSEEDLMFFRFDEYLLLCINDLIGRISGGTWLAWIFFAWNFFVNVYMNNWLTYVSRFMLILLGGVANIFNNGPKEQICYKLQKQAENAESDQNQALDLIEPAQNTVAETNEKSVTAIVLVNQILLWFALTHIFTFGFASKWSIVSIISTVIMLVFYGLLIFLWLPTIAGGVFNGTNINKEYVKEVMKRHSQVDKHVLIEQYRSKNNGEMPLIHDKFDF